MASGLLLLYRPGGLQKDIRLGRGRETDPCRKKNVDGKKNVCIIVYINTSITENINTKEGRAKQYGRDFQQNQSSGAEVIQVHTAGCGRAEFDAGVLRIYGDSESFVQLPAEPVQYAGEYMKEYSWAESRNAQLSNIKNLIDQRRKEL